MQSYHQYRSCTQIAANGDIGAIYKDKTRRRIMLPANYSIESHTFIQSQVIATQEKSRKAHIVQFKQNSGTKHKIQKIWNASYRPTLSISVNNEKVHCYKLIRSGCKGQWIIHPFVPCPFAIIDTCTPIETDIFKSRAKSPIRVAKRNVANLMQFRPEIGLTAQSKGLHLCFEGP